jgi:geranylgeranyl diphosphate synthase type I
MHPDHVTDADHVTNADGSSPPSLEAVRAAVDRELHAFLDEQRADVASCHPDARFVVDELARLLAAGGKRIRPALCYWGHRAAGGSHGREIVRAAASLELLHTFAIVHDDVMDDSASRRGVPTIHARLAGDDRAARTGDPARFAASVAILAGDLASVLADRLFFESGFSPDRLLAAKRRYDAMRIRMGAGQLLDLVEGATVDRTLARTIASLKTASYTTVGPLEIGAALAGPPGDGAEDLATYGAALGEAFQLRDDVEDAPGSRADVDDARRRIGALVSRALTAIDAAPFAAEPKGALRELAASIAMEPVGQAGRGRGARP